MVGLTQYVRGFTVETVLLMALLYVRMCLLCTPVFLFLFFEMQSPYVAQTSPKLAIPPGSLLSLVDILKLYRRIQPQHFAYTSASFCHISWSFC